MSQVESQDVVNHLLFKSQEGYSAEQVPRQFITLVNTTLVSNYLHFLTGLLFDSCPSDQVTNVSSEICADNNDCFEQMARKV